MKANNNVFIVTYTKMQCAFKDALLQILIIYNQTQLAMITNFRLSIVLNCVAVTPKLIWNSKW